MSFSTAAARLKGLLKGAFRGIGVLTRGVSPRIVSAETIGTGGVTQLSGPELAARLGLGSTWLYFSVQSGTGLRPGPDRSSRPPASEAPAGAAAPAPTPQGGSQAPAAPVSAQTAKTGGVSAG